MVKFFEKFSTHSPNSLKQDPMVGSPKLCFSSILFIFTLKNAILEHFFVKCSQGILGVNFFSFSSTSYDVNSMCLDF
jgi:hypothetical protein